MTIYSVYIINKAGGLIYQHDHNVPRLEIEKTFSFPLEITLKVFDEKIVVAFGERDGIKGGRLKSGKLTYFCTCIPVFLHVGTVLHIFIHMLFLCTFSPNILNFVIS